MEFAKACGLAQKECCVATHGAAAAMTPFRREQRINKDKHLLCPQISCKNQHQRV